MASLPFDLRVKDNYLLSCNYQSYPYLLGSTTVYSKSMQAVRDMAKKKEIPYTIA